MMRETKVANRGEEVYVYDHMKLINKSMRVPYLKDIRHHKTLNEKVVAVAGKAS